jgi:16S rRNA (guanine(1405)-N(7))-methyltransferase
MSERTELMVRRISAAPKYAGIHPDTIAHVVRQEAAHAANDADLERLARLRLHKVVAEYLLSARPARLLRGLDAAVADGPDAVRAWCRATLAGHFSTAERLPDLDEFYPALVELTGPPASIADLACALNPFTLPWLRDATDAPYTGYDFNRALVAATDAFAERVDPAARVSHGDVLVMPEPIVADVALLLKTYHCIEDRLSGAGLRLVADAAANRVVVSFPLRAMHGRAAVFTRPHIDALLRLADERGWAVRRGRLSTEEFVVICKDRGDEERGGTQH